jgi:hypothetical protein
MAFEFGDEFGASEDEPTGEETPEELVALERLRVQKAHQRAVEAAAAQGLLPPPPPAIPQAGAPGSTPNIDAAATMAQMLVNQFTRPVQPPQDQPQNVDEALRSSEATYMGMVDKRLTIASLYRTLLDGFLFSDTSSEESRVVDYEVKAFVRERLGVLFGMADEAPKKGQLSDEELSVVKLLSGLKPIQIEALKMLANKMVEAGALTEPEPAPTLPTQPHPTPAKPTTVVQRRSPTPPQLIQRPVPQQPQPAQPPAPVQQDQTRRGPGRPAGSKNRPKVALAITDTTMLPDGTVVEVKRQRIQRPAGQIPFPSDEAMGALSQQQAVASAAARVASPDVVKALTAMANTPSSEE